MSNRTRTRKNQIAPTNGDGKPPLPCDLIPSPAQFPQFLQLTSLFDYLEDVMAWVKDRDGRFCWVNRTALMVQAVAGENGEPGKGAEAILGKTDHDFAPAFLADQYQIDDEQVLSGIPLVNRIELFRRPDGTTGWHVTNKIPLYDERGRIIGTAGIAQWLHAPTHDHVPGQEFASVLAFMRDHYRSAISNRQLARLAHISVRAFERRFLACFHLTPQKYLRNLRMRIASHALVYSNQLLSEVATNCGFADQSHFTREFRRHFGRTPRDYREHFTRHGTIAVPGTKNAAGRQVGNGVGA